MSGLPEFRSCAGIQCRAFSILSLYIPACRDIQNLGEQDYAPRLHKIDWTLVQIGDPPALPGGRYCSEEFR